MNDFSNSSANIASGKTYISEGTVIVGNIKTKDDITVKGKIQGDIHSDGTVVIDGMTDGEIKSKCLTIKSGKVKGKLDIEEKLNIEGAESVEGEILTKLISVQSCSNLAANIKTRSSEN